jgi:hypothetical protein
MWASSLHGRETLSFGADDQQCGCFRARFVGG